MRNIGLHTVLYFLTGVKVSVSSEVELSNFVEDTINLARSLVIYSREELQHSQKQVGEYPENVLEWRYIKHLQGQYHAIDQHISVGLNYDINSMSKDELYLKYPGYEVLIDGIRSPVYITSEPKNMEILNYKNKLVDKSEIYLIDDLQKLLYKYESRWNVSSYGLVTPAYVLSYKFIMSLNIVTMLLSIRDSYRNTNHANNFHIKQYLQSNGMLGRFYSHYSSNQKFWLYRNIQHVLKKSGSREVDESLIKVLFTDEGFNIRSVGFSRVNKIDKDSASYRHSMKSLQTSQDVDYIDGKRLKYLTDDLTVYNKDVHFDKTDKLGLFTLQNNQETKYYKVKIEVQGSITISTIEYKLSYWLYSLINNEHSNLKVFTFETSNDEKTINISPRTGYILLLLLICDLNDDAGALSGTITRTATNIQKDSVTLDRDTLHIEESDLVLIEEGIKDKPSPMTSANLSLWTDEVIEATDGINLRRNALGNIYKYLEFQSRLDLTVEDHDVDLDIDEVIDMDLLNGIKGNEEKAQLFSELIEEFTGLKTTSAGEEVVRAAYFIDVYRQLSSYDTDIILEGSINPPSYSRKVLPTVLRVSNKVVTAHEPCNTVPFSVRMSTVYPGRYTYVRTNLKSSSVSKIRSKSTSLLNFSNRITSRKSTACQNSARMNFNRNF